MLSFSAQKSAPRLTWSHFFFVGPAFVRLLCFRSPGSGVVSCRRGIRRLPYVILCHFDFSPRKNLFPSPPLFPSSASRPNNAPSLRSNRRNRHSRVGIPLSTRSANLPFTAPCRFSPLLLLDIVYCAVLIFWSSARLSNRIFLRVLFSISPMKALFSFLRLLVLSFFSVPFSNLSISPTARSERSLHPPLPISPARRRPHTTTPLLLLMPDFPTALFRD